MTRQMPQQMTPSSPTALLVGTLLAIGTFVVVLAAPADAHASLVASSPEQGQRLHRAPDKVSFTFDQNIRDPAYVAVTGPDGTSLTSGDPQLLGPVVSQQLRSTTSTGTYTIAYRVISADGHPVAGQVTFAVGTVSTAATTSSRPAQATRGFSTGVLVELGVGVALLLLVVLLRLAQVREER